MRALVAPWLVFFCLVAAAQVPQPPEIAARNYMLVDISANQVLAAKDVDSPVEPESLTKLMVAYLVFQAVQAKKIDLQQTLPVSERASRRPGSRMFIAPKMQVPVDDLLKGLIVSPATMRPWRSPRAWAARRITSSR
jgi:serine-type D-Ala-D-Ala carboxypeptidase (penicillin-binding protein 5/6)